MQLLSFWDGLYLSQRRGRERMTQEYEIAVEVLFPQYFLEKSQNIFMYVTRSIWCIFSDILSWPFLFLTTQVEGFASRGNELFHNGSHKPGWLSLRAVYEYLCYEHSVASLFSLFSMLLCFFLNVQNSCVTTVMFFSSGICLGLLSLLKWSLQQGVQHTVGCCDMQIVLAILSNIVGTREQLVWALSADHVYWTQDGTWYTYLCEEVLLSFVDILGVISPWLSKIYISVDCKITWTDNTRLTLVKTSFVLPTSLKIRY